jgi:type II secretory pathway pseudopilin PulG
MNTRRRLPTILSLIIVSFGVSSVAQSQSTSPDFATMKSQLTARLQQALSCVQSATNAEALRQCAPAPPDVSRGLPLPPLPSLPQN